MRKTAWALVAALGMATAHLAHGAAPSAVTNAATGIVGTSATLNGIVNDNGQATTVTFQYVVGATTFVDFVQTLPAGSGATR